MPSFPPPKEILAAMQAAMAALEPPAGGRGRTRARILKAASELFVQNGYRRTSVDQVAEAAHVAKATVYAHFKSKNDLLLQAVVEEKKRLMGPFIEVLTAELEPMERLQRYLELMFLVMDEAPLGAKLMRGDREITLVLEEMHPDLRAQLLQNQTMMTDMMLAGVGVFERLSPEEQARRKAALAVFLYSSAALIDARVNLVMEGGTREELAKELARVIAAGLGAP